MSIEADQAEKAEAEGRSNCGFAVRDERGYWVPVMDDGFDYEEFEAEYSDRREALQNV